VSKLTGSRAGGGSPLLRLLEAPGLAAALQALPAPMLGRLVDRVGLEDAGEIVALASTAQLAQLFDEDLWRANHPGADEAFDPERFALWLEVMLEAGDQFTAERVAQLDPDLVTLALCELALVVDEDQLRAEVEAEGEDDRQVDKALASSLCQELGTFLVIARRPDAWDPLITVLVALDRNHHEVLERLLERAAHISGAHIEDSGGLYQALSEVESLVEDARGARDDRRAASGYVSPADARSFLALCRQGSPEAARAAEDEDPVTRAYFRSYSGPDRARAVARSAPARARPAADDVARRRLLEALAEVVGAAEDDGGRLGRLLAGGTGDTAGAGDSDPLAAAMARLRARDPVRHQRRLLELNYLANVLISGYAFEAFEGRQLRPVEAGDLVLEVCRIGLAQLRAGDPAGAPLDLARVSVVKAFRLGWNLLHQHPDAGARLAELLRRRG
jgi:hypothetical protein